MALRERSWGIQCPRKSRLRFYFLELGLKVGREGRVALQQPTKALSFLHHPLYIAIVFLLLLCFSVLSQVFEMNPASCSRIDIAKHAKKS
jgi:hypothetical protein